MRKHSSKTPGAGRAPSQRQLRVGELVRRRLSEIFQRGDVHDEDLFGMSITVGEVRVSPDLKIATAYVLPLGGGDKDKMLDGLRRSRAELRHSVVQGINLKFAPELRFEIDDTFDRLDATRAMFANETVRRDVEE